MTAQTPAPGTPLMRCAEAIGASEVYHELGDPRLTPEAAWRIYGSIAQLTERYWRDEVATELHEFAQQLRAHRIEDPRRLADHVDAVATLVNGTAPQDIRAQFARVTDRPEVTRP